MSMNHNVSPKTICAIGTGTMGAGTALMYALAGHNVFLFGRSDDSLEKGCAGIARSLQSLLSFDLITQAEAQAAIDRITLTTDLSEAARDADLVMESAAEELEVKQDLFTRLEGICRSDTIFATNTSALSPSKIASVLDHPERFIVLHGFTPPPFIPVVEIIPGLQTNQATIDECMRLLDSTGKTPVLLHKEAPGFVVNRIQIALLAEALAMIDEGISPEKIDREVRCYLGDWMGHQGLLAYDETPKSPLVERLYQSMRAEAEHIVAQNIATADMVDRAVMGTLGRRLGATGPLESMDMGGLDVFANIFKTVGHDLACPVMNVPTQIQEAIAKEHLGTKSGHGIYAWPDQKRIETVGRREELLADFIRRDRIDRSLQTRSAASAPGDATEAVKPEI